MNKRSIPKEMVSTRNKSKVIPCSTPEHHGDSPSRDSDSTIYDSDCPSPVPFLCTQDGAEGETDVIWNFYTPKSGNTSTARDKNSTPLSRRSKKCFKPRAIEKQITKRRPVRPSQNKTQLFQELVELNQNLHELMAKKQNVPDKPQLGSDDDIFQSQECSPKCIPKSSSRCLRKNVLSSNFGKPDLDAALESDDSMNECLLKASQFVEEKMLYNPPVPSKKKKYENQRPSFRTEPNMKLDQDSMDALIDISMKLDSPIVNKVKCESPCLNNDSFDYYIGNLNDSALDQLTQMPIKADLSNTSKTKDWTVKELVVHDSSPIAKTFHRHNSMPASPSIKDLNKPSTSGMAFGRFSSMPFRNEDNSTAPGDSPIRCTPEEIKKKHLLAREKLMAKRLLPFTSQQSQSLPSQIIQYPVQKKTQFQFKTATATSLKNTNTNNSIASSNINLKSNDKLVNNVNAFKQAQFQPKTASSTHILRNNSIPIKDVNINKPQLQHKTISTSISHNNHASTNHVNVPKANASAIDLKLLIEQKRQEALMKLRRRQPQNK